MDQNRLRWATRRGMLELDLILLPFLDNIFPSLTEQQQLLFEKLLECEDQDMFQWFLRKSDPEEADILTIVNIIRQNTGIQPE
ncbi:succinate dehydrogenase assembly factor 2 [Teredinibacter waterburyi]|uniref:FAD assembly factor SdhE n=1 Tax=Teredinibacter waterburyi TaxID=1500538 RepID=UPI00165F4484|nr:succinate dehydrogenase assembly factor 2 [Teredinibacter waterburyi]